MSSAARVPTKYAFRRRFQKHNYSLIGAELSDDDEDDLPVTDTQTAAAAGGLDAQTLSHMEERDFKRVVKGGAAKINEFLGIRNHLLTLWQSDRSKLVLLDTVLSSLPTDQHDLCKETHVWLRKHGCINYGCLGGTNLEFGDALAKVRKENTAKEQAEAAEKASVPDPAPDPEVDSASITDDDIVTTTVIFLRGADMNSTTERQIRKAVETALRCDLSDRKLVIRGVVTKFLEDPESYEGVGVSDTTGESAETIRLNAAVALAKAAEESQKATKPKPTKPVLVIGAGPAGLAAASSLRAHGFTTVILEARSRVGGRVFTASAGSRENPLSVPLDFGASIVTGIAADAKRRTAMPWLGVRADPSAVLAIAQLNLNTHLLRDDLPLYDGVCGNAISVECDKRVEKARDVLMDHARLRVDREGVDALTKVSLETVIADELKQRYGDVVETDEKDGEKRQDEDEDDDEDDETAKDSSETKETLSAEDRRALGWHWANLEYGCSAPLSKISMAHWNQDEHYGGFGGGHVMLKGGYGQVTEKLAEGLEVVLDSPVRSVTRTDGDGDEGGVLVETVDGTKIEASACIVTVPLGCLKNGDITFEPKLSLAKQSAIQKLGYGNLNKIALEFTETFWDDAVDYFGCAADTTNRGRNFMYWNLAPVCGKPVLVALVAGEAAEKAETESDESLVKDAMSVLRRVASRNSQGPGAKWSSLVPDPTAYVCTRWGSDPHSRGSYSYVAVGASGDDYDELGRPEGRVLFAGEHTCREHPDTVGGAMLTGWRAARHAMHIMNGDHGTPFDEVFAMPTMDDLVFADGDDEDSESGDDDGDSDDDTDGEEIDDDSNRKKTKKKRGKKSGYDSEDGPEDDDAARERARKRLELETAERLEQLRREAKEATEGKEEVKRVLRVVGEGFGGREVEGKFSLFCDLAETLETQSGRLAFINAAVDKLPEKERATWALRKGGFDFLTTWLTQVTTKETGAAFAGRAISLLLKCPPELRLIKKSGAAKVMQTRFATHPKPEVRLLARKCAHRWTRQLARVRVGRGSDAEGSGRGKEDHDDDLPLRDATKATGAGKASERDDKTRIDEKKPVVVMTTTQMIASAAGLAEGGDAEAAAAAAAAADAALADATVAAAFAKVSSVTSQAAADLALRQAWSTGGSGGKHGMFKQQNFSDYTEHKKRKREHKKVDKARRAREDAAEAAEDAVWTTAGTGGASTSNAEKTSKTSATLQAAGQRLASDAMDTDRPNDPREIIKKQVMTYARGYLQKSGGGRNLSKRKRDEIANKVVGKVVGGSTSLDAGAETGGFLTQQRKKKIQKMLDAYAAQ